MLNPINSLFSLLSGTYDLIPKAALFMIVCLVTLFIINNVFTYSIHFNVYYQCQKVINDKGETSDKWSFSAWHDNTFIGKTIGKLYIAFQSARFYRKHHQAMTYEK